MNMVGCEWYTRFNVGHTKLLSTAKHIQWTKVIINNKKKIDFQQIFSLVVKPCTIRTMLSVSVTHGYSVHQLDVQNAFINRFIDANVFIAQPLTFLILSCHTMFTNLVVLFIISEKHPIHGLIGLVSNWSPLDFIALKLILIHSSFY